MIQSTIEIHFDSTDFIVAEKPAEENFHNEQGQVGFSNRLSSQVNAPLFPVHRLDKMTSGLLVFAKAKTVAAALSEMFANRQVKKTYLAISNKKPKKKQGKIQGDMQKTRNGSWKLTQQKSNPAVTHFQSASLSPGIRLFWLTPLTGKTHQLRVALKAIGSPILGDERYGGEASDRGYLHAYRLCFEWNNQEVEFKSLPQQGELFQQQQLTELIAQFESK